MLIEERLKRTLPPSTSQDEICGKACELIEKDSNEETNDYGQRLRETFHLADVFIDGLSRPPMGQSDGRRDASEAIRCSNPLGAAFWSD